jgi:hypothetical protein
LFASGFATFFIFRRRQATYFARQLTSAGRSASLPSLAQASLAWLPRTTCAVWPHHLLEAGDYFGSHTRTVDVTLPSAETPQPVTHGVDTSFLVFNAHLPPA